MESNRQEIDSEKQELQDRIKAQDEEIRALKAQVALLESKRTEESEETVNNQRSKATSDSLSAQQIERYSRQLLLNDGFGVQGQLKLLSSSVLVIGAGGIGSTVLLYLAAAGVGKLSIVDFDSVERSNLHRQIIHKDANVGMNKAISACRAVKELNPSIECDAITQAFSHDTALSLVEAHDVVVDASDNQMTRYLVNDACVLAGKPLVSGSAIGTEGQLTVYNYENGPCYRCLYPKPNSSEGCKSCSDSGVLGPVPGLIGILQSVEVLKVLTGVGSTMKDRLLMYDSLRCSFINVKKPPKSTKCTVCGNDPTILSMNDSWRISQTCRGPSLVQTNGENVSPSVSVEPLIPANCNISCSEYKAIRDGGEPHVLLDVRVPRQFEMCSLDGAINVPLANLPDDLDRVEELSQGTKPVYCLCRRGIFSVEATRILSEARETYPGICAPKNIRGGLQAWSNSVDPSFPKY